MDTQLMQRAQEYFQDHLGISLDALTAPIDPAMPAGKSLRGSGVYNVIEQARRRDDASVPLGAWEHDLKRADWDKVSTLAGGALAHKSKDLQLAAWLLEAQIHKTGFAGIGACMLLMQILCERYWGELHPQADGGDLEYRANIFGWINAKLLPALRLVPITASGRERDYNWADWEQARRNEQLRAAAGGRDNAAIEGPTAAELTGCIAGTATDAYIWLHHTLADALLGIDALAGTLDRLFGKEAPGLSALADLLEQIHGLVDAELRKRGVGTRSAAPDTAPAAEAPPPVLTGQMRDQPEPPAQPAFGAIRDRADAYARLAETADFLMRLEPHSPVPYLVKRATEWGRLNTGELYQELFLRLGGQLNIFEMLGLDANVREEQPG